MLTTNPFAELAVSVSPGLMQTVVVVMILLVVGGTLFDVMHKRSAQYFAELMARSRDEGSRPVGAAERTSLMIKTAMVDVATSAEFCNPHRRVAHLLTMYGFILYLLMTICLVFGAGSGMVIFLWYVGALMVAAGGYWFWFFIRVDVAAEGHSPFQLVRADLFVLSLLATVTFGILWGIAQSYGTSTLSVLLLIPYAASALTLFGGVPWSKFAHMFFKPAAAFQKRVAHASGQAMNLPTLTRDDPEQRKRHSMELLRDAPMNMGLGIKREDPNHY
jgi:hypothetical protein